MDTIINTCSISSEIINLAYYSHLIPVFFSLSLAFLVFLKSHRNRLSKIFLLFSIMFSFWLVADLITWVSNNYFLIYTAWAPVDLIETLFYLLGLYFVMVFFKKSDISFFQKLLLFLVTLIPFVITITGKSVLGFNYPVCEASNNNLLLNYRFYVEVLVVLIIFIYVTIPFFKRATYAIKKSSLIVAGSMFLFLTVFGVTSYLSAITGYYELNLYALFIIPVFLIAITYSIFSLDIFNVKIISTYFIVVGVVILTASQLIFVTSTTNKLLTILTVILTVILSVILFRNLKKETDLRVHVEKLSGELEIANEKLKGLDKLKTEFLSLASHQLRSPLTAIKGYASMITEGDYGEINPKAKEMVDRILESSKNLTLVVEDLLNVTKIEAGGMKYEMAPFNFGEMVTDTAKELSINAEKKGLKFTCEIQSDQKYIVNGDKEKLMQVILNLIDNSIKYTKNGSIEVSVTQVKDKVRFAVRDTGMGMTKETKDSLFKKFARGDGGKMNSSGSGLGLYLAKEIVEAHKGKIGVDSEGLDKGSTFYMELDVVK